jgi:hypothetical protein
MESIEEERGEISLFKALWDALAAAVDRYYTNKEFSLRSARAVLGS